MPKMKTHSGTKKRVRMTGTGKLKLKAAARRHLLLRKASVQKRGAQDTIMSKSDMKRMKKLLPYGA